MPPLAARCAPSPFPGSGRSAGARRGKCDRRRPARCFLPARGRSEPVARLSGVSAPAGHLCPPPPCSPRSEAAEWVGLCGVSLSSADDPAATALSPERRPQTGRRVWIDRSAGGGGVTAGHQLTDVSQTGRAGRRTSEEAEGNCSSNRSTRCTRGTEPCL